MLVAVTLVAIAFALWIRERMSGRFMDFLKKKVLKSEIDWRTKIKEAVVFGLIETLIFVGVLLLLHYAGIVV